MSVVLVMHVLSHYKPTHCDPWLTDIQVDLLFAYREISSVGCSGRQRMVAQRTDRLWGWKRTAKVFKQEEQHKSANKHTDNVMYVLARYPSVLMKPFTVPSAKSETIAPICRKLVCWVILQRPTATQTSNLRASNQPTISTLECHKNADAVPIVIWWFSWLFLCTALQRNPTKK